MYVQKIFFLYFLHVAIQNFSVFVFSNSFSKNINFQSIDEGKGLQLKELKRSERFTIEETKKGEIIFKHYCSACHVNGNNRILPEKNLKKETLEIFGINNQLSLIYQISNGKNGMPAFGGRLKKSEIKEISSYFLK